VVTKKTLATCLVLTGLLLVGAYFKGRWDATSISSTRIRALEAQHARTVAALESAVGESERLASEAGSRANGLSARVADLEARIARDAARFGAALAGVARIEDGIRRAADDNIAIGNSLREFEGILAELESRERAVAEGDE